MPKNAALSYPIQEPVRPGGRQSPLVSKDPHRLNDLDLDSWKDYPEILTDSLWIMPERDSTGVHSAEYHGNFIPQIPHQMMLRYTRENDVVLDPFLGMGTTMLEGLRLGRHVIGVELQESVCHATRSIIQKAANPHGVSSHILCADSCGPQARELVAARLEELKRDRAQLIVLHPPYHDIIHFSKLENDLSNAQDLSRFLHMFGDVVANFASLLESRRYLVLVIGDKYADGEWVPLGSRTMDVVIKNGFTLKSWVIKNMSGNRAKRNLDNLWRYRALRGGFYIFKHEHVLVFRKDR